MPRHELTARHLLRTTVGLAAATVLATYALAVRAGRQPAWMPFISETPFFNPEGLLFRTGLTLTALGFVPLALLLRRRLAPVAAHLGPRWAAAARLAPMCALGGSFFLLLTANFTWLAHPLLHSVSAALFFGLFQAWGVLTTAITWRGATAPRGLLLLRVAAIVVALLGMIAMGLFFAASGELDQWGDYDPAREHNTLLDLSAFCEWVMVAAFFGCALTFGEELRDVPLRDWLPPHA